MGIERCRRIQVHINPAVQHANWQSEYGNLKAKRNIPRFASVKQSKHAFKRRVEMRIKYALATTSVLALLAGPALAQAPASNPDSAPATKPGGPNVTVQQPAPAVTVKPSTPNVSVQTEKPDVHVTQPPPQVIVKNPEPNVQVQSGQPDVKVLPAEKPNVTVNQAPGTGTRDVNVGTTAAPDTRTPGAGAAAVAPATGTFPAATDVEKFIGKDVYGANGQKVGELDNVLISPDGRVRAGIVEFGGFLGIGTNKVAVPWNQLQVTNDRVVADVTKEQVRSMPRWEKDRPSGEFAEYKAYR
jgi:sporulation protein YlmC with PRC-barrel domain